MRQRATPVFARLTITVPDKQYTRQPCRSSAGHPRVHAAPETTLRHQLAPRVKLVPEDEQDCSRKRGHRQQDWKSCSHPANMPTQRAYFQPVWIPERHVTSVASVIGISLKLGRTAPICLNLFARHCTNLVMLEVVLTKRGRSGWEWRVLNSSGKAVMGGRESSRPAAKYQGERALFLLLAHPKRSSEAAD